MSGGLGGFSLTAGGFGWWGFAAMGASSLASAMPALILVNSDGLRMSIGTYWIMGLSDACPAGNSTTAQSRMARCSAMEMKALFRMIFALLRFLFEVGHERDPAEA